MSWEAWASPRRARVEGWLSRWHAGLEVPEPLGPAMGHVLLAPAKRVRPLLALAAAEACGGAPEPIIADLCVALELVHTYSLIHDDLPSMDDDALRRGRPTCHRVYGEAMAILAGDALLTEAFALLARGAGEPGPRLSLLARLGRAAGAEGMVAGQVLDVTRVAVDAGLAEVERVHALKTGALIACAAAGGAEAAGASPEDVARLESYGRHLGLAFQVADDVLDEVGDPASLGKAAHKDRARDTATVPRVIGVEGAQARARELIDAALAVVEPLPHADPLRELARRVVERTR